MKADDSARDDAKTKVSQLPTPVRNEAKVADEARNVNGVLWSTLTTSSETLPGTPSAFSKCLALGWRCAMCWRCTWFRAVVFSIVLGIAHPFFTELSKSAKLYDFEGDVRHGGRPVMPFHLITLTLASQTLSVLLAACIVVCKRGSWKVASCELFDPRHCHVLLIGMLYGLGDFLQTAACNKSSTPVVLMVGQSKLVLSALLSKFILGSSIPAGWTRLLTLSMATMALADISANGTLSNSDDDDYLGALLALLKAILSTTGAVLSEREYKQGDGQSDFWVVSFRVQLSMLLTSLALLVYNNEVTQLWTHGIFSAGPYLPCADGLRPMACGDHCTCATTTGWDRRTCLAMIAIILNGYSTGLFLKHLSAVCKAVCNVGSSGLCCAVCWLLGFSPYTYGQAAVSIIVLLQSYEYLVEKAAMASKEVDDAAWAGQYSRITPRGRVRPGCELGP
ncbi:unnamed protein product [Durusdinium trenchii]